MTIDPELQSRINRRLELQQEDMQLGAELRDEALARLGQLREYISPEHVQSWTKLIYDEALEPVPGLSAGAALLCMLDVVENRINRQHQPDI